MDLSRFSRAWGWVMAQMRSARFWRLLAVVVLWAGLFVWMMFENIPLDTPALPSTKTVQLESRKSTCEHLCRKPKEVHTNVEVTKTPATPAGTPSLLSKALDNDAGVVLLRLVASFLSAVLIISAWIRFFRWDDGDGVQAERRPDGSGQDGGESETPDKHQDNETSIDAQAKQEARQREEEQDEPLTAPATIRVPEEEEQSDLKPADRPPSAEEPPLRVKRAGSSFDV